MVPKIAGQYVAKRLYDQILAPPPKPSEDEVEERAPVQHDIEDLDGQVITDDEGRPVGTVRRLRRVAVYVVADRHANPESELLRSVNEPESRLLMRSDGGRLTALIYVPDPDSAPAKVDGIRSDDI